MSREKKQSIDIMLIVFAIGGFLGSMAFGAGWWMVAFITFTCGISGIILAVIALHGRP